MQLEQSYGMQEVRQKVSFINLTTSQNHGKSDNNNSSLSKYLSASLTAMGASPSLKVSASLLSTNPKFNKHICIVINASLINLSILFKSLNSTTLTCFSLYNTFTEVQRLPLLKSRHNNYPTQITGGLVISGNLSLCGGIRTLGSYLSASPYNERRIWTKHTQQGSRAKGSLSRIGQENSEVTQPGQHPSSSAGILQGSKGSTSFDWMEHAKCSPELSYSAELPLSGDLIRSSTTSNSFLIHSCIKQGYSKVTHGQHLTVRSTSADRLSEFTNCSQLSYLFVMEQGWAGVAQVDKQPSLSDQSSANSWSGDQFNNVDNAGSSAATSTPLGQFFGGKPTCKDAYKAPTHIHKPEGQHTSTQKITSAAYSLANLADQTASSLILIVDFLEPTTLPPKLKLKTHLTHLTYCQTHFHLPDANISRDEYTQSRRYSLYPTTTTTNLSY
jgi:hypothetical protein